jgi:hypothetical protein
MFKQISRHQIDILITVLITVLVIVGGWMAVNNYYDGRCIEEGGAEHSVVSFAGVYCHFYFEDENYSFFVSLKELADFEIANGR